MNEENINKQFLNKGLTLIEAIAVILVIFTILCFFLPEPKPKPIASRILCLAHLKHLAAVMNTYADENSGSYPIPDNWCDLSKPYLGQEADSTMRCPSVKEGQCHYAMNPNCEPNSPPETVLLFETKGGWNLSGGPELMTLENHGGTGCCILFNDGSVNYVQKEIIPNLKWNAEEPNE